MRIIKWGSVMRYVIFLVLIMVASSGSAQSRQFCFASAETYYEQVYCQLQAKAQIKSLPAFHQFRKNPEDVQYSLLKRPAERNAIKLPAPTKKRVAQPQPQAPLQKVVERMQIADKKLSAKAIHTTAVTENLPTTFSDCQLTGKILNCGQRTFALVANKSNHRLASNALSPENKMELPSFQGGNIDHHLGKAYQQYIRKMCDIGLGGVTMTYGKFAYLYQDLRNKGLDFTQRFETMYSFLKKDKAKLGVSEAGVLPAGFNPDVCVAVGEHYYVCDHSGRNYIFELQ